MPTLVLDKSVFQRIAEVAPQERTECWAKLRSKFLLVIPNVLVEEILVNWGAPGATPSQVVNAMVQDVLDLHGYWLADEVDWAYHELVLKKRTKHFIEAPREFIDRVSEFRPTSADYQRFLRERQAEAERTLKDRLRFQQEAAGGAPHDRPITDERGRHFILVPSEIAFFKKFVVSLFHLRDQRPELWYETLNRLFGDPLRSRYPREHHAIEIGLRSITSRAQLFECAGTFNILVAKSCYFWAPLTKVGPDTKSAKVLLQRSESGQKGNIHDERYIAVAMLCQGLATKDRGMAQVGSLFQRLGLWHGQLLHYPHGDIRTQIDDMIAKF